MKQAWDKNVFENGQSKKQGTGPVDSTPSFERLQRYGNVDLLVYLILYIFRNDDTDGPIKASSIRVVMCKHVTHSFQALIYCFLVKDRYGIYVTTLESSLSGLCNVNLLLKII